MAPDHPPAPVPFLARRETVLKMTFIYKPWNNPELLFIDDSFPILKAGLKGFLFVFECVGAQKVSGENSIGREKL